MESADKDINVPTLMHTFERGQQSRMLIIEPSYSGLL
ncbi:hypothetical protein PALA46_00487 [Pseudomonas aeruginosa]|nr:hypothetical protein [Pseudomonas aeruginosa]